MPPPKNWARKAIGSNGNALLSLVQSGGRGSVNRNPITQTMNMTSYIMNGTLGKPLPRPSLIFQDGLFQPDSPSRVNPVDYQTPGQYGGPTPRIWQYPIAWNLPTGPRAFDPVSFDTLRSCADSISPVRTAINLIKDEVSAGEWAIKIKDPSEVREEGRNYKKEERKRIRQFFEKPDRLAGRNFADLCKIILEEMLVTDALSIYPRRTRLAQNGIDIASLQVLDGSTIKPLLDLQGGRPQSPAPAFQQYLYGVPRSEFAAYASPELLPDTFDTSIPESRNIRAEELIYKPYTQRANSVYGLPPTETVIQTAVLWLRRSTWWQNYYHEGDIPAAFVMGGEDWTPEQLERWEGALHSLMAGDPSFRHRLKAVPYGTNVKEMKQPNFDVAFDQFIINLVAMIFRTTPQELYGATQGQGQTGRGALEQSANQNERKFIFPLRRWLEGIFDDIIAEEFHEPDLCLRFNDNDMQDELKQAQIDDVNLKNGSSFIDEVREERGQPSLGLEEALIPNIETRAGLTPLNRITEFTEQLLAAGTGEGAGVTGSQGLTSEPVPNGGSRGNPGTRPGPSSGSPGAAKLSKAETQEAQNFVKFLASGRAGRFNFNLLQSPAREALEKLAMNWDTSAPDNDSTYAPHDGVPTDLAFPTRRIDVFHNEKGHITHAIETLVELDKDK